MPPPGPWSRLPASIPRFIVTRRPFSSTRPAHNYDDTLKNLKIGKHTKVIFQGFTGKQATANAKESLEWGTNIVGGVTPGREAEHLGLPVLPSVRKAMETLKPDATGIYVAAHQATGAIKEAIEAEVPLIVAVAEHIPLHDLIKIHSMLKTQSKCRLVGANSPGIISAVGKCRIGFQPLPCFKPGKIGIVARSGTLSYETAASTLRAGLGQSMCIGVGGDILPGTTLVDGLKILAEDGHTEGIALVGEIGGVAELVAADWIREYRATAKNPKPIAALVAGIHAVPGRIMGHAGAFALPGEPTALEKAEALRAAGAAIVNHPSRFGAVLKAMLGGQAAPAGHGVATPGHQQRRGMHTHTAPRRRPQLGWTSSSSPVQARSRHQQQQRRSIYLTQQTALDLLRVRGVAIHDEEHESPPLPPDGSAAPPSSAGERFLAVSINRETRLPCLVASPGGAARHGVDEVSVFDFDPARGSADLPLDAVAGALGLPSDNDDPQQQQHHHHLPEGFAHLVRELVALFLEKEAFLVEARLVVDSDGGGGVGVARARVGLDDAAHRSAGRQADAHALRDVGAEDAAEVGVERDGIVYVKLPDPSSNIGTLVNGAGLAMNTVDALADAGGRAANFLDTGGKATSETVKRSFEVILTDPRVKCILVNIFGGLTRGDMIAEGIVMAFRDLRMTVPVVVRIRGTNEAQGQHIIAESGLPLYAFDDFDEAAAKAIELADQGQGQ